MFTSNLRLLALLAIVGSSLPFSTGLQCHNCLHIAGVLENPKCEDGTLLTEDTIRACTTYSVLNGREMQAIKIFSPEVEFQFVCLKAIINAGELNMVLRGCYAQDTRKMASWIDENECQSPNDTAWKDFRDRQLSQQPTPVGQNSKMDVCACYDTDGCNSGSSLRFSYILVLVAFFICIFFKSFN